jgi:uncharacterized membrane protein YidH (DUF202 family)
MNCNDINDTTFDPFFLDISSMTMSLLRSFRAPLLDNTGSTARDHLASERTFLAWLRTGLGFVALGIAIERFSQLPTDGVVPQQVNESYHPPHTPKPDKVTEQVLVGSLLAVGAGSVAYGSARYFENLHLLQRGKFRPAYYGAAGMGVAMAGLAGLGWTLALRAERRNEHD